MCMINLLLTKTIDSTCLLKKLKENRDKGLKKHLFIVPDRVVMSYEMLIFDYLNIEGSMDITVDSFRTLASRINKTDKKVLNQQTEIMLIRKIIEDNAKELKFYKTAVNYVGFAKEVLDLIALIRGNGISTDTLKALIENPAFPEKYRNKTKDILLLYSEYIKILKDDYSDYISNLEYLIDHFHESEEYANTNIYIAEFDSFSKIELDIISAFAASAPNVYLSLPYTKGENDYIFPKDTIDKIIATAKDIGVNLVKEDLYKDEKLAPGFKELYENLYAYMPIKKLDKKLDNISVMVAKNPEEEVKTLAIQIKQLVQNPKLDVRYKDIACVCCDTANYKDTIETVFKRYDIPYFSDTKEQLSNQCLTRLLLNGLKINLNGYLQIDVFSFIKDLPVLEEFSIEDINEFENYCLQYGIEYEPKFKNDFSYNKDEHFQIKQNQLNKLRKKIVAILDALSLKECVNVSDYVKRIKNFFEAINAEKLTDDLAQKQLDLGYDAASSVTNQVYKKISAVIDQMDLLLGECRIGKEKFLKILESTFASIEIATIPMYIDCVYVGDLEKSRYEKKKYLFVIGANESMFPREIQERGLLSDDEFEKWNKLNVKIYPDLKGANRDAKLNVLMALMRPQNELCISYPLVDMQANPLEKANIVGDICRIIGQVNKDGEAEPRALDTPSNDWTKEDFAIFVGAKENALEAFIEIKNLVDSNLLEKTELVTKVLSSLYFLAKKEDNKEIDVDQVIKGERVIDEDIKDGDVLPQGTLSSSKIESYFKCPFAYCIENILRIKDRKIAGVDVRDTGIILHECMEKYFTQKNYLDKTHDEIFAFVVKTVKEAIVENPDFSYLEEPEFKLVYDNFVNNAVVSIELLVQKILATGTKFTPYKMEARFASTKGMNGKDPVYGPMIIKGISGPIQIHGEVDRIDKYDNMIYTLDYKSKGSISFDLKDIVWGVKLQSMLYLKKVADEEHALPAGAFYLSLGENISKDAKEDKLRYVGVYLNDEQAIIAMDKSVYDSLESVQSELFPIKKSVKKDGTQSYGPAPHCAQLELEQFKKLFAYLEALIVKAQKEMQEGYIKISPIAIGSKGTPCRYCKYKSMCRIDDNEEKIRKIKTSLKSDELIDILGK